MKFRIVEIYGNTLKLGGVEQYRPWYTLEVRPDWWPLWFREYTSSNIDDLKARAKDKYMEKSFKKKVLVEGTLDDILAFGEQ